MLLLPISANNSLSEPRLLILMYSTEVDVSVIILAAKQSSRDTEGVNEVITSDAFAECVLLCSVVSDSLQLLGL